MWVINDIGIVKEKICKFVVVVMEELGYWYNVVVVFLVFNKINIIGYVVLELYGFFFGVMMGGIE